MNDQPNPQQPYHDDEIDLRKLFQAIGNFFVGIGHGFINIILAVRRTTLNYKYLLIASIIIGIVTGFSFNKFTKPFYQTSLLVKSDYINAKLVENAINKLNLLCEEEDRTGLAKVLSIDLETAKLIRNFDFEGFVTEEYILDLELMRQRLEDLEIENSDVEKIVEQLEIENQNTFRITVKVLNPDFIDNLENAVVGYFRNNPYVANRIKSNNARLKGLISKLSQDVALLDSLKKAYNLNLVEQARNPSNASKSVLLGESGIIDPMQVYVEGITLFTLLQEAKTALDLGSSFEVIDGFTTFSKPESANLRKAVVFSIGIWLGLAYILILLIEINRYLSRIEEHGFKSIN